jgi:hypothetical protein
MSEKSYLQDIVSSHFSSKILVLPFRIWACGKTAGVETAIYQIAQVIFQGSNVSHINVNI